jgi:hypothetical protein
MRFGKWRALTLALTLAAAATGLGSAKRAQAQHTIPREVQAYNFTTGGEFMAPPVPYGEYAKDYVGDAQKHLAGIKGHLYGLKGGHGLLHHGKGDGNGCGEDGCGGNGHGCGGAFGHKGASDCGVSGCFGGMNCGLLGHHKNACAGSTESYAGAIGYATTTGGPSAQAGPIPSAQGLCGQTGCKIGGTHSHFGGSGLCGEPGCGLGNGHSHGNGLGLGNGEGGCSFCGGKGCSHCLAGMGGLGSHLHGKLASLVGGLHKPKMKWFVGAGGPVPLTPGYVPYIVTTRSPRDFFAFPPMNPDAR